MATTSKLFYMKKLRSIIFILILQIYQLYADELNLYSLLETKIPIVNFENTSIEEAVDYLRMEVRMIHLADSSDDKIKGIAISPTDVSKDKTFNVGQEGHSATGARDIPIEDDKSPRITFTSKNSTVREILREIGRITGCNIYVKKNELYITRDKILETIYEVPKP